MTTHNLIHKIENPLSFKIIFHVPITAKYTHDQDSESMNRTELFKFSIEFVENQS